MVRWRKEKKPESDRKSPGQTLVTGATLDIATSCVQVWTFDKIGATRKRGPRSCLVDPGVNGTISQLNLKDS